MLTIVPVTVSGRKVKGEVKTTRLSEYEISPFMI